LGMYFVQLRIVPKTPKPQNPLSEKYVSAKLILNKIKMES
jgi:hypothetical protein